MSLHNILYWDYGQYAGLGESAHSRALRDGRATAFEVRDGQFIREDLTALQAAEEMVIMGLRHKKGLDLDSLESRWGYRHDGKLRTPGFTLTDGPSRRLVPSERGLMNADAAALEFLSR